MRVYRHFVAGITGTIDVDRLTARVGRQYPDVASEEIKLFDTVKCVCYRAISTGKILLDGTEAEFSLTIMAAGKHVIIFEYSFQAPQFSDAFLDPGLNRKKLRITSDGEVTENPLYMHGWMIYFDLLDFNSILPRLNEISMFDEQGEREAHEAILENSLIDCYYLGEHSHFQTRVDMGDYSVLCNERNEPSRTGTESVPVFADSDRVRLAGRVYSMNEDDAGFMELYRYMLYRSRVTDLFNTFMVDWLENIHEQARLIRDNLKETNKIYWTRLKNRLEVWDLNFLDFHSSATVAMNAIESVELEGLSDEFDALIRKEHEKARTLMMRNMETLRHSISNLKTPCEAHDEELLQKETEKVNERIMLLSFLAMSIPLLGAILAPGIATSTKLVAAAVLFTLPAVYMYFRRIRLKKGHRKATADYLSNQRKKLVKEMEDTRVSLKKILEGDSLGEKTKSQTSEFLRKTLEASEKQLEAIDAEIAKYRD